MCQWLGVCDPSGREQTRPAPRGSFDDCDPGSKLRAKPLAPGDAGAAQSTEHRQETSTGRDLRVRGTPSTYILISRSVVIVGSCVWCASEDASGSLVWLQIPQLSSVAPSSALASCFPRKSALVR